MSSSPKEVYFLLPSSFFLPSSISYPKSGLNNKDAGKWFKNDDGTFLVFKMEFLKWKNKSSVSLQEFNKMASYSKGFKEEKMLLQIPDDPQYSELSAKFPCSRSDRNSFKFGKVCKK